MIFNILVLDETSFWCEDIVKRAGKVFGIYLYNPKEVTHCCELTGSYALYFLNSVSENSPENEDEREKLYDDLRQSPPFNAISYLHCHGVDKLPQIKRGQLKVGKYRLRHLKGYAWESIEEAEEFWQGNPDY